MQIYSTPKGPALLVRHEDRGEGLEYLFCYVADRMMWQRWEREVPAEFELVHDVGARAEAEVCRVESNALIREKAVLLKCLEAALRMLDDRSAEEVRDIYRAESKKLDVISLTRGG